ncbi:MAG: hypothetical protein WC310_03585 [Patescibacteria group bacterium]|jgi:hypothetical protein
MIKNKKVILISSVLLLAVLLFFGCAQKDENGTDGAQVRGVQIELKPINIQNGKIIRDSSYFANKQAKCDTVSDNKKDNCLQKVKLEQAIVLNQVNQCADLGDKKDVCYREFAFKQNNIGLCESISDTTGKDYCKNAVLNILAAKQKKADFCLQISDEQKKISCLSQLINENTKTAFCQTKIIADNNLAETCVNFIYYKQAWVKKDRKLCDKITVASKRDECYQLFDVELKISAPSTTTTTVTTKSNTTVK